MSWKSVKLASPVDVAVLQEARGGAVIGINVVVHDVDAHLLLVGREVVDEVVHRLLQLAAATRLVIGHHRTTALEIDCERVARHAIGLHIPVHGRTQAATHLLNHLAQVLDVDLAILVNIVTVAVGAGLDDTADAVEAGLRGVALQEGILHHFLDGRTATSAQHKAQNQRHSAHQQRKGWFSFHLLYAIL